MENKIKWEQFIHIIFTHKTIKHKLVIINSIIILYANIAKCFLMALDIKLMWKEFVQKEGDYKVYVSVWVVPLR